MTFPRAAVRGAALVAAGAVGTLAASAWSPLRPDDPLRGTVTALPLVLGLVAAAACGTIRVRSGSATALESLLLAVWLGGALARPALALAGSERVLAVALALLLAAIVARRLVELGSILRVAGDERSIPWRLFLLALAVYTALLPWATSQRPPDGDEPWYLLTAHSLVQDLDTDLADEYRDRESLRFLDRALEPQPGDPRGRSGEVYSRHDPLLPLYLAPFYAVAGKHGALFAIALLAAAVAATWWPLARELWPDRPGARLAQWALLGLAPPFLLYSHQLWVEVPAALLVTVVALSVEQLRRAERRTAWAVLAGAVLALPALKLRFGLLSASLLVMAFVTLPRHRRRLLVVGAAAALVGSAFLLYNRSSFGNALRIHDWHELLLYRFPARDYAVHFLGLFFDLAFGLFAAAPLWMLLIPGLARSLAMPTGVSRRLCRDLAIVCLPYLVLVASRREWFGGWSPPFRYPLALLPLLALLAVPAWSDLGHRRARSIAAALGLATLAIALVYVAIPGFAYSFADGRSRLLDPWSARWGLDLAALLPSGVRPRAATWWVPLGVTAGLLALWPWRRDAAGTDKAVPETAQRGALLAGALALTCAVAALPALGGAITTRRVELESPHVRKTGGHPDPDPWMFDRRRFPEAWVLPEGASARARVRAGGPTVELRVDARAIVNHPGALALHLACGDRLLARITLDRHDTWEQHAAGPLPWDPGCELVASVPGHTGRPEGVSSGVAVDRIELRWR